jgi:TonB-dependent starch-binding outer membrane protein SusC
MLTKKKFKSTHWFLIGFFILASTIVNAQGRKVTGKITSVEDGQGLPGASVVIKGTTKGVSADYDGSFSIQVEGQAVLTVSYIGFIAKDVNVGNQTNLNVVLLPEKTKLEEVVVVGYGTRKKSDITGSVASVKSEQLTAYPVLSGEQALQGRAAGVAVQSNNAGEPGAPIKIRVRGGTSINASGDALIVVDGFVGASMPAPEDIASMDVLKDASATAIYGSRGSNGVILVTTKKGRSGKMNVEFSNSASLQEVSNELELLDANQFAAYRRSFPTAATATVPASPTSIYTQGPANTDWQDVIFRSALLTNTQLSFSGGSDKIKYYVSGNYFDQQGVVINSGVDRYTILGNLDADITSKLKVGLNLFKSKINNNGIISQTNTGGAGQAGVISSAYRFTPDLGIFNPDGTFTRSNFGDQIDNPFATATENVNERETSTNRVNFFGNYQLFKGLEFKATIGLNTENTKLGRYIAKTLISGGGAINGLATVTNSTTENILSENYLTYTTNIGKGKLTLLGGYSYQKNEFETYTASSNNFITDSFSYYNLQAGSVARPASSNIEITELISTFGRLNFDYDGRYLFTATARRDGASAFSKNNKYAFFPSGAIGWNISKESFLKESKFISNLKLRASYGLTGNPGIGAYETFAKFTSVYANIGDVSSIAYAFTEFQNDNLKWETTNQTNLGLDLGLFEGRINLSVDYYKTITKDLLFRRPLILYSGVSSQLQNVGELENKGLEFTLNTKNISTENVTWTTDFNIAFNRNKILKLPDNNADVRYSSLPSSFGSNDTQILRVGEPVGLFLGYIYDGVIQEQRTLLPSTGFELQPGGQLIRDVNNDNRLDAKDLTIIGDPNPDFILGFTNDFRYKNFDLNVFFQGSVGGDILNYTLLELASGTTGATTEALNAWTPTNTNTDVPSIRNRNRGLVTSRFVYDASYIRLKNLSVGYSLPKFFTGKLGLDKIRFYISAQNLYTLTEYPGSDPEVNYRNDSVGNSNRNLGLDYGSYPNIKTFTMGLNVKF